MGYFGFGKREQDALDDDLAFRLESRDSTGASQEEIEQLKDRVDRLSTIVRALWSVIREHHDMSDAALIERMERLKVQEGEKCPRCGRVMSRTHHRCLYCGESGPDASIMDWL